MVKAPSERAVRLEWALEEASAAAARGRGGGGKEEPGRGREGVHCVWT